MTTTELLDFASNYAAKLIRGVKRLTGAKLEVEDYQQDAIAFALGYDGEESDFTRRLRNHLRRLVRIELNHRARERPIDENRDFVDESQTDPFDAVAMIDALGSLSPRRRLIIGCIIENHTVGEISETLGVTHQAVSTQLLRAVNELRKAFSAA